jgi:biopolymer transport protein ExbD
MKFVKPHNRRPAVPIISLIDILAILLIYVMLTHDRSEEKAFANITPPTSASLGDVRPAEGRVELAITSDANFLLGASPVEAAELEAALARLKRNRPDAKLELKADEDAPLKSLVFAWDALTGAGFRVKDVPSRILLQRSAGAPESPTTSNSEARP